MTKLVVVIILAVLAVFLAAKEITSGGDSELMRQVNRYLTIPILSLIVLFVIVVVLNVTEILR